MARFYPQTSQIAHITTGDEMTARPNWHPCRTLSSSLCRC